MDQAQLFRAALGLAEPWRVVSVGFDKEAGRLDLSKEVMTGSS